MATPHVLISTQLDEIYKGSTQRGSASIEFVLLFPALFLILYAIVTYGLVFGAQQALTLAAAEGGRAALRYQQVSSPGATTDALKALSLAQRQLAAEAAAQGPLSWLRNVNGVEGNLLTTTSQANCPSVQGQAASTKCITVRVTYNYSAAPLVPSLLGPLLLLPVPSTLSGVSVVQLSDMQLL